MAASTETSWDVAARSATTTALPPPVRRRRRVQSDEDLRLAVPVRAELWNLFVPSSEDAEKTKDKDKDDKNGDHANQQEDDNDAKDEVNPTTSLEYSQQRQSLESAGDNNPSPNNNKTGHKKLHWYQGAQHENSILTRVELQIVVYEEEEEDESLNDQGIITATEDNDKHEAVAQNKNNPPQPPAQPQEQSSDNTTQTEIVLYRGTNDNGQSVHPCWYHLQDQLAGNEAWINLHRDTYESLEFQFYAVSSNDNDEDDIDGNDGNISKDNKDNKNSRTDNNNTTPQSSSSSSSSPFFSCPVHPSQLVALGYHMEALPSTEFLPINTLVVYFSDHSLRILPQHYDMLTVHQPHLFNKKPLSEFQSSLVQKDSSHHRQQERNQEQQRHAQQQQQHDPQHASDHHREEDHHRHSRFGDNAFRALDAAAANQPSEHHGDLQQQQQQLAMQRSLVDENEDGDDIITTQQHLDDDDNDKTNPVSDDDDEDDDDEAMPDGEAVLREDLARERQQLLQLIQREAQAHERQRKQLQHIHDTIAQSLIPTCQEIDRQTQQVIQAIAQEGAEQEKLHYLLEAHRIRLVRGLEACFPIDLEGTKNQKSSAPAATTSTMGTFMLGSMGGGSTANAGNYILNHAGEEVPCPTLRGWSMPVISSSFNNTTTTVGSHRNNTNNNFQANSRLVFSAVSDEELSAVLGVFAHVVVLLAKYLDVAMPYRIFTNSSRSAVQDDRGIIFPLFLARPVEREQVEHALHLVERNVICIAKARGISTTGEGAGDGTKDSHKTNHFPPNVLELVHRIYKAMTVAP